MELNSSKTVNFTVLLIATLFIATGWMVSISADGEDSRLIYVNHLPISIDGDLELQNMASLETWPGSGSEIDPYIISSFHINGTGSDFGISLTDIRLHLVIRNNIIDNTMDGDGIIVKNSDNVVIQNNRIKDSGSSRNIYVVDSNSTLIIGNRLEGNLSVHSIQVRNSRDVEINSNEILWNDGNGIYAIGVEGLRIIDNGIVNVNYTGLITSSSESILIQGNMIQDCGASGVSIYPSNSEVKLYDNRLNGCDFEIGSISSTLITLNNTIDGVPVRQYSGVDLTGTTIPHSTSQFFLYNVTGFELTGWDYTMPYDPIYAWNSDSMTIENCSFNGAGLALYLHYCNDLTLKGNLFWNLTDRAVYSFYGTEYMITGNNIGETPEMLYIGQGGDITISENVIDVVYKGLTISQPDGISFLNNTITGGASLVGINLAQVDDPVVSGNTFRSYDGDALLITNGEMGVVSGNNFEGIGTGYGMNISSPNNMVFEKNLISGFENGMELSYQSTASTIHLNRIEDNSGNGIRIWNAQDFDVKRNLIFNNTGYGVDIDGSSGCLLHNNTFIENQGSDDSFSSLNIQARDDSTDNFWNGPTHGNYWRDLGSDDTDGDGILEDPYLIFGTTSYDNKPLAMPGYEYLSHPVDPSISVMKESILLEWQPPEIDIDDSLEAYRIYRTGGSGSDEMFEVLGTILSYLDEDVEDGVTYTYNIVGLNRYGEGSSSLAFPATPDSTPPVVEITSPMNGTITSDDSFVIEWDVYDNVGVEKTEININGDGWIDTGANSSYGVSNLTEGLNVFEIRSTDALENTAYDEVRVRIDQSKPVINITSPLNGTITTDQTMVVYWEGNDMLTEISSFQFKVDNGDWMDTGNGTSSNVTLTLDGSHFISVKAIDAAGNENETTIEVLLDTTEPSVFITFPAEGYNTMDTMLDVSWAGYDLLSGIDHYTISIDEGVEVTLVALVTEYSFNDLSIGNHTVVLTAVDLAGNEKQIEVTFEILDPIIAPVYTIITGQVLDNDGNPLHDVKVESENGETTVTDSEGYFALEVERGQLQLTFSKSGYEKINRLVFADPFDENETLAIEMEEEEEEPGFLNRMFNNTVCQVCCILAVVVPLILILLGLLRRSRSKKRKKRKREERRKKEKMEE